ncbi:PREDICTED: probable splicing factor, arginine/serine-rich 7 [Nicrophorus vespilloides]|uniref:Probable splicing factor, arginine/serine-rich 7 n=1 Tax=Nicrophorus vespilloides TaxID=110193 RepID=A0ABM1MAR2_NICVS|nr:PREDICTED: probable splicing factor, arginine/serine-rich 7 [Nicrophorus vespilloides]
MAVGGTKVVQVTNIAPQATKDQMQTLFGFLGKIEDIRLYPTIRDVSCPVQSRICYIKFMDSVTVGIAQHMTNTVFIDRALIVIPVQNGDIPDEYYALEMTKNGAIVPGLCPSEPKLPPNVVNSVSGSGIEQVIMTTDPQLEANGLSPYPPLPANYDSCKIEEIRRTVLAGNIEPATPPSEIIELFVPAGEIKYLRICTRTSDGSSYVLIEFSEQQCVLEALKLSGTKFKGKTITVNHSTQAIVKPQAKSNEAAQREIEEAMSRVKEAQSLISAAIDPVIGMLSKDKRGSRRSRSRSRGRRRRSRSRSRSRRSRSRERRRRSRSRSRDRRKRSRSRRRSRSRSRRSRSRRSRSRRSRSRSKSRSKSSRKDRRKSKDRTREKSRERRSRDKDNRDRSRERSSKREEKDKDRGKSRCKSKDKDRSREKEIRDKKSDRDSTDKEDKSVSEKKSSRSPSRSKYRSKSRDRKDKKRSRSTEREKRRRSASRERRRKRSRSKSKDKKKRERRDKERSHSRSKVPRNYDEEEKGFDADKDPNINNHDVKDEKESSVKSENMDISNSP